MFRVVIEHRDKTCKQLMRRIINRNKSWYKNKNKFIMRVQHIKHENKFIMGVRLVCFHLKLIYNNLPVLVFSKVLSSLCVCPCLLSVNFHISIFFTDITRPNDPKLGRHEYEIIFSLVNQSAAIFQLAFRLPDISKSVLRRNHIHHRNVTLWTFTKFLFFICWLKSRMVAFTGQNLPFTPTRNDVLKIYFIPLKHLSTKDDWKFHERSFIKFTTFYVVLLIIN